VLVLPIVIVLGAAARDGRIAYTATGIAAASTTPTTKATHHPELLFTSTGAVSTGMKMSSAAIACTDAAHRSHRKHTVFPATLSLHDVHVISIDG
jgi:hypothetical protein